MPFRIMRWKNNILNRSCFLKIIENAVLVLTTLLLPIFFHVRAALIYWQMIELSQVKFFGERPPIVSYLISDPLQYGEIKLKDSITSGKHGIDKHTVNMIKSDLLWLFLLLWIIGTFIFLFGLNYRLSWVDQPLTIKPITEFGWRRQLFTSVLVGLATVFVITFVFTLKYSPPNVRLTKELVSGIGILFCTCSMYLFVLVAIYIPALFNVVKTACSKWRFPSEISPKFEEMSSQSAPVGQQIGLNFLNSRVKSETVISVPVTDLSPERLTKRTFRFHKSHFYRKNKRFLIKTVVVLIMFVFLLLIYELCASRTEMDRKNCFSSLKEQRVLQKESFFKSFGSLYYLVSIYPYTKKQESIRKSVNLFSTATGRVYDACSNKLLHNQTWSKYKLSREHPFFRATDWNSVLPRRMFNFFTGSESCAYSSSNNVANDMEIEKDDIAYASSVPVLGNLFQGKGFSSTCIPSDKDEQRLYEVRNLMEISNLELRPTPINVNSTTTPFVFIPPERRKRFPRAGRRYSDYDRHTLELLVMKYCPKTKITPKIILEDLFRNQMGHDFEHVFNEERLKEFKRGASASPLLKYGWPNGWAQAVEEKYGRGQCDEVNVTSSGSIVNYENENKPCIVYRMDKDVLASITGYSGKGKTSSEFFQTTIIRVEQRVKGFYEAIPANNAPKWVLNSPLYPRPLFLFINGTKLDIAPIPSLPTTHYRIPLLSETVSVLCPQLYDSEDDGSDYVSYIDNVKSLEEEYHVHPLPVSPRVFLDRANITDSSQTEIGDDLNGIPNMLMMVFDAAGRQDVVRSLPRVASWLRHHEDHKGISVVDMKGATTLGHSTYGNMVPALSGIQNSGSRINSNLINKKLISEQNIFAMVKKKYGSNIITTSIDDTCDYTSNTLLSSELVVNNYTSLDESILHDNLINPYYMPRNIGGPSGFLDKEITGGYCHVHYGGLEGNYVGPYSILRRCIGGNIALNMEKRSLFRSSRHRKRRNNVLQRIPRDTGASYSHKGGGRYVHDYNVEYIEDQIMMSLATVRGNVKIPEISSQNVSTKDVYMTAYHWKLLSNTTFAKNFHKYKRFIHMGYFMEAHEGSRSVLSQIDLSVYRLLRKLEVIYNFFDVNSAKNLNNRNILVLMSDHGNHMGPFFEWSLAGKIGRTMPFITFVGNVPRAEPLYKSNNSIIKNISCGIKQWHNWNNRYVGKTHLVSNVSELDALLAASNKLTVTPDLYTTFCDLFNFDCGNTKDLYNRQKKTNITELLSKSFPCNGSEYDKFLFLYKNLNEEVKPETFNTLQQRYLSFLDTLWTTVEKNKERHNCKDVMSNKRCVKYFCTS